jgi:alkaline phosphatase D
MRTTRRAVLGAGLSLAGLGLAATRTARAAELAFAASPFTLGVASGYPEPNAVVLWTRLAPEPLAPDGGLPPAAVAVEWELAADERFRGVVRRGTSHALPDYAHSVHVEVAGLDPERDYWYRFRAGGQESPTGRTRTAAARGTLPVRFSLALASCQHYEQGHYAAYRAMAADAPDLVVHVGDYIYEGRGQQGRVRSHDAPECHTLEDYRQRYAIYKSDPSLQAAHAASPWMLVSDDHEVANDYAGDESAQDDPREWFLARRAAAYRAYYEHQPMPRRLVPLAGVQRLHTARAFGDLVSVHMLDGRQYRSRQACGPAPLVEPCAELVRAERTMLGKEQERWLTGALGASRARWNLLGQQTLFAHFDQSGPNPLAYWADGWNGYPAARARLVDFLAERAVANPVVLTGDIHAFLVNDVHREPRDLDSPIVATELVTSSISSQGPPQESFGIWLPENPNVRFARGGTRGYVRATVEPERLTAELVGVDDPARADSPIHTVATFEIASGTAGIAR